MAKLENNIEKKKASRFLIVPIKKHLARFFFFDWKRIRAMIPKSEIETHNKSLSNPNKLGKYKYPILFLEEDSRLKTIEYLIKFWMDDFIEEEFFIEDYTDLKIEYYTNRRNLNTELLPYINKNYSLLKITVPIKTNGSDSMDPDFKSKEFAKKVKLLNERCEQGFYEYVILKIERIGIINRAIDEIYLVLGLKKSILKKSTLIRQYFRIREQYSNDRKLYNIENIHPKIFDNTLFDIYKEHICNKLSYSKLAIIYKLSKTTISRICNNKRVCDLYKKVTKRHNSYFDYINDMPIKFD